MSGVEAALPALVLLPTLVLLGLVTFDPAIKASIEDVAAAQQINRIRHAYIASSPQLAVFLVPAVEETPSAVSGGAA